MILITEAGAHAGAATTEIRRLAALLDDLKRLASGGLPTDAELRDAPFLDGWAIAQRTVPCLIGRVTGHPVLGGPTVRTSDVWALAPGLGFARTLSHLYTLGRPHPSVAVPFRMPVRH